MGSVYYNRLYPVLTLIRLNVYMRLENCGFIYRHIGGLTYLVFANFSYLHNYWIVAWLPLLLLGMIPPIVEILSWCGIHPLNRLPTSENFIGEEFTIYDQVYDLESPVCTLGGGLWVILHMFIYWVVSFF